MITIRINSTMMELLCRNAATMLSSQEKQLVRPTVGNKASIMTGMHSFYYIILLIMGRIILRLSIFSNDNSSMIIELPWRYGTSPRTSL